MTDPVRDLLAAIRAHPEDDPPRQVLADFYEDRGDTERADFIRAQSAQATMPRWDSRWLDLELAARAPVLAHWDAWRAELPTLGGVEWGSFERGLVRSVAFDDAALVAQHAEAVMQACPVRSFALRWPRLGDRPELAAVEGLRELVLVGTLLEIEDMRWLARSPILSTIDALRFVGSRMQDDALQALLSSPHLRKLRSLSIPRHHFGNEAIDALVAANPTLHELDLSVETQDEIGSGGREETVVGEMGIARLATWPGFSSVRRLDLTGIQMGEVGLMAVLASKHNGSLRALRIRSVSDWDWEEGEERPDVLGAFEHAREGLRLEELDIGENELTPESAYEVERSPVLMDLKVLRLEMNNSYQQWEPLQRILGAPWMDCVRVLRLDDNTLETLQAVLTRAPRRLHTLSLVSDFPWSSMEGLSETLARTPELPALQSLDLTGCRLDDDGLASLGALQTLPKLIALRLGPNQWHEEVEYTEQGIAAFARSPLGKKLRSLVTGLDRSLDRLPKPPQPHWMFGDDGTGYAL